VLREPADNLRFQKKQKATEVTCSFLQLKEKKKKRMTSLQRARRSTKNPWAVNARLKNTVIQPRERATPRPDSKVVKEKTPPVCVDVSVKARNCLFVAEGPRVMRRSKFDLKRKPHTAGGKSVSHKIKKNGLPYGVKKQKNNRVKSVRKKDSCRGIVRKGERVF